MVRLTDEKTTTILNALADALEAQTKAITESNSKDLSRMSIDDPLYDRLLLNQERIKGIASDVRNVAKLPPPVGETLEENVGANGLKFRKVRVPLGVVGVIYEARPNVTVDVVSLCLRSCNAVVLKGGSNADDSNRKLVEIIHQVLEAHGVDKDIVQLLPPNHEAAAELMNAVGFVDVLIPRGSQRLINAVRQQAKVPVIETGASIVHTYFDKAGNAEMAATVVCNAKTRRVSVCNALDCLIIHRDRLADLALICKPLGEKGVEIMADKEAYATLQATYPARLLKEAQETDFDIEFLSMRMSVKTVADLDEAMNHIYTHSLKHSEAIITDDPEAAERFLNEVDAAAVYVNTSTAFTDGAQFGLGAEIGISTQKLHARGPMALRELTSYKWQVIGNGQIRS
jgi:glutamate-5-semialdehyde dehydrogenase